MAKNAEPILITVFAASSSWTLLTEFDPVPPKNSVPSILIVVAPVLLPEEGVTLTTVGGGALVRVNFTVLVELVPPCVVTITL